MSFRAEVLKRCGSYMQVFTVLEFNLERDARQDDPLSTHIFILCLETFLFKSEMTNPYEAFSVPKH